MDAALHSFTLGTVLLFGSGLFVLTTLYFGTRVLLHIDHTTHAPPTDGVRLTDDSPCIVTV
jgi:hypothetical protein